jgi:hypothetical protein
MNFPALVWAEWEIAPISKSEPTNRQNIDQLPYPSLGSVATR